MKPLELEALDALQEGRESTLLLLEMIHDDSVRKYIPKDAAFTETELIEALKNLEGLGLVALFKGVGYGTGPRDDGGVAEYRQGRKEVFWWELTLAGRTQAQGKVPSPEIRKDLGVPPRRPRAEGNQNLSESLVGFDARTKDAESVAAWDADRRNRFLLRTGVGRPLSVDVLVWPSILRPRTSINDLIAQARRGISGLETELSTVHKRLLKQEPPDPPSIVAVTLEDAGLSPSEADSVRSGVKSVFFDKPSAWRQLGYDVADASLLSGLSNCGYDDTEAAALREEWAQHINESHLIIDAQRAALFRKLCNERVPEHAPFFVFGIYLVS